MLEIQQIQFFRQDLHTRFPFRYGIASMEEVPYLCVRVVLSFNGILAQGMSADLLPPKWFTKDPASDYATQDLPEMLSVIRHAADVAMDLGPIETFFYWWHELYLTQNQWAQQQQIAPLLANFGVSLIERAVLDAMCRANETTIHQLLRNNVIAANLEEIRPVLRGLQPADVVVRQPSQRVPLRHTIGIGDPLTDDEIPAADRIDDGLPHSLVANIQAYGLKFFKIKLVANRQVDCERLLAISKILETEVGDNARFTMDGNENYAEINHFRDDFEVLRQNPELQAFLDRGLLFVEQPLHRDHALAEAVKPALAAWTTSPPLIIDESDAELSSLPYALELGYSGTSHKNCKGVMKGLLNAASVAQAGYSGRTTILSGEDLANLGPIALLQDLAVAACLGVQHVERNGHHYFAGLSQFSEGIQQQTLKHHSDLYHAIPNRFIALNPVNGELSLKSVLAAPFGMLEHPDVSSLTEWEF